VSDWRVDLVRASYAAFAAAAADALVALYDEACEWDWGPASAATPQRHYRGHAGLRELMEELHDVWNGFQPSIAELRVADQVLLARGSGTGRSRREALALDWAFGQVLEFRDEKLLRVTVTEDPPPGWDDAEPVEMG